MEILHHQLLPNNLLQYVTILTTTKTVHYLTFLSHSISVPYILLFAMATNNRLCLFFFSLLARNSWQERLKHLKIILLTLFSHLSFKVRNVKTLTLPLKGRLSGSLITCCFFEPHLMNVFSFQCTIPKQTQYKTKQKEHFLCLAGAVDFTLIFFHLSFFNFCCFLQ